MSTQQEITKALAARWQAIFTTLHGGGEVPPSQLLRCEGMMETLVLLKHSSAADLQMAMADEYQRITGESLCEVWGPQWAEFFPFPQIPAFGARAPVFPSTRD